VNDGRELKYRTNKVDTYFWPTLYISLQKRVVPSIHTTAVLFLHFFSSKMLHFEHEECCKAQNKDRKIVIKAYSGMLTTEKSQRLNRPADLHLCVTAGHEFWL